MPFADPFSTQDPSTNVVAINGWGDAVNLYQNDLRGAKAGCLVSTVAATVCGTKTIIPFATEVFDNNACHDPAVNNSRITVPSGWGGLWYLGANMRLIDNIFTMFLVLNGDTTNGLIWAQSSNAYSSPDDSKCSMSTIYPLVAGDYVQVAIDSGSSGTVYVTDANYFFGYFMAA